MIWESIRMDGIYRLTNETISLAPSDNNGSVSYGLDPVGNRLAESSTLPDIPSGTWNFNPDDELSSETYDQNGNVTAAGGKSFTYDAENHLLSMTASGTSASLVYDAFGNRISKTVNGVTTQYLVDDLNPTGYSQVFDELTNGAVTRTYTYGLQRIDENQIISNQWTPSFYGYDGGGNVRQLTSMAGAVTDSYEYDAFGNLLNSTGTTPNAYMYRGEFFDSDLGLYYLRARWMNPLSGRFMSRDPFGGYLSVPFSQHAYNYGAADPINWRDPSGRDLFEYAFQQSKALPATAYLNTLGCFASIGFVAAADELNAWTVAGAVSAAYGCVSSYIWPGGAVWLSVKTTVDVGVCGLSLIQVANDFSQELQGQNVTNKTFAVDAVGGVLGCAITNLGKVLGEH
jgi:RHS repeat-associated protein